MASPGNSSPRLVKCPRCLRLLPEPPDLQVYKCGGCGTILKAKNKRPEDDQDLQVDSSGSATRPSSSGGGQSPQPLKETESSTGKSTVSTSPDDPTLKGKSKRNQSWTSEDDDFRSACVSLSNLSLSTSASHFFPYKHKNSSCLSRNSEDFEEFGYQSPGSRLSGFSAGSSGGSSRLGRTSRPSKRHCLPIMGGSPFVICNHCRQLLHLPADFLVSSSRRHRLRCGSCSKILVFLLQTATPSPNPLHQLMGYPSARDILFQLDTPGSRSRRCEGDGGGGSDGQHAGGGARRGAATEGAAEIGAGDYGDNAAGEGAEFRCGRSRYGR